MNYFISSWISNQGPLQVFSTIGGLHIVSIDGIRRCRAAPSHLLTEVVHLRLDNSDVDLWEAVSQHDCEVDDFQEDSGNVARVWKELLKTRWCDVVAASSTRVCPIGPEVGWHKPLNSRHSPCLSLSSRDVAVLPRFGLDGGTLSSSSLDRPVASPLWSRYMSRLLACHAACWGGQCLALAAELGYLYSVS